MRNSFLLAALVAIAGVGGSTPARAAELVAYWDFEHFDDAGTTIKSTVGGYVGAVQGSPAIIPISRPGGGGNGLDTSSGYIQVDPATSPDNLFNKAAADNSMSIVFWEKNNASPANGCCDASTFWVESPSSANGTRGIQVHVPWSNGEIMFDHAGCCTTGRRVSLTPAGFDFTQWHHYALIKDNDIKQIWIDGVMVKQNTGPQDPLPSDFTVANIGAGGSADGHRSPDATIDDFAVYKGALTPAEIQAIAAGAKIGAAVLLARWDFEHFDDAGTTIKSTVGGYVGAVQGSPAIIPISRPGGGGNGLDTSSGYIQVDPATSPDNLFNKAAADNSMSIVFWEKNNASPANGCCDASTFWVESPSSANGTRGIQVHVPWSNGEIMFDHAGCCTTGRRVSLTPAGFDFTQWHHYALIKDNDIKQIWIDGVMVKQNTGPQDPLPSDFTVANIGAGGSADGHKSPNATIDDFAVYKGALTPAEIQLLATGPIPFTDSDGDGMSDEFEIRYGLKPNDPTDAHQDPDHDGIDNLAEFIAGTNPTDTTAPVIASAVTVRRPEHTDPASMVETVTLTFSEEVVKPGATNLANYSISPSLNITKAELTKINTVKLTTTTNPAPGTVYTVTVNNVLDTSKNRIATNSSARFASYALITNGILRFAYYGNIAGTSIGDVTSDPRYPATPDFVAAASALDNVTAMLGDDSFVDYGGTITGLLTPTETGDYDFFLRSNQNAELHFNPTGTDPANAEVIATDTGRSKNFLEPPAAATTAVPINLTAGTKYFLRLIYNRRSNSGDLCQVAWRNTTDLTPAAALEPIPGRFFTAPELTLGPGAVVGAARDISGNNLTIVWTGGGTLQRGNSAAGPWTDVVGAFSPHQVATSGSPSYFRIKQQ